MNNVFLVGRARNNGLFEGFMTRLAGIISNMHENTIIVTAGHTPAEEIRQAYCSAVAAAGMRPIIRLDIVEHTPEAIKRLIDLGGLFMTITAANLQYFPNSIACGKALEEAERVISECGFIKDDDFDRVIEQGAKNAGLITKVVEVAATAA